MIVPKSSRSGDWYAALKYTTLNSYQTWSKSGPCLLETMRSASFIFITQSPGSPPGKPIGIGCAVGFVNQWVAISRSSKWRRWIFKVSGRSYKQAGIGNAATHHQIFGKDGGISYWFLPPSTLHTPCFLTGNIVFASVTWSVY